METFLPPAIIGGILIGIVNAVRSMVWHNEVPPIVSKLRWVIALLLAAVLIMAEVLYGLQTSSVSTLNAATAFFIAEALRAPKKPKDTKPPA